MSEVTIGGCGCCSFPPPPRPYDEPDDDWVSGYYIAVKYARVVRDGFPDLRTYFNTIGYDTGERFLSMDWDWQVPFQSVSRRDHWEFFQGHEQLVVLWNDGGTIFFSAGEFTPYSPTGTENGVRQWATFEPGWNTTYTPTNIIASADSASGRVQGFPTSSFTATASDSVPESLLNTVEDKLDVCQFLIGKTVVGLQYNPSDVASSPKIDGPRTGVEYACATVPTLGDYHDEPYSGSGGTGAIALAEIVKAFNYDTWARGNIASEQDVFTGLKLKRDKARVQVGSKSPGGHTQDYRKFIVPDGFNLIAAGETSREPSIGIRVNGLRLPANTTHDESGTLSLPESSLQTFDPDTGEVYFFAGTPYGGTTALPSIADVLTPLPAKLRLYRNFGNGTIGLRFTSEDRCLKHEIYRKVNAGAESLLATVTAAPYSTAGVTGVSFLGWSGFINPDTGAFQFPLGYEWLAYDATVSGGNTYTYRIKSYYDMSYKSDYSAAYSVAT